MLTIVVTFMGVMMFLPRGRAIFITGWMWITLFGIAQSVFGIRIIIIAFQESLACGFMYLFVPFYSLIYIFTRWKKCGRLFIVLIVCGLLQLIGLGLIVWSASFKGEPEKEEVRRPIRGSPVAVASAPFAPSPSLN